MRTFIIALIFGLTTFCCSQRYNRGTEHIVGKSEKSEQDTSLSSVSLIVLGTIQDGGSPHIGCKKSCCSSLFERPDEKRKIVSLGIIDKQNKKNWIFEASPDLPTQMKYLHNQSSFAEKETPTGIFLSHAHIGHYAGLMYLGKEAMNSQNIPVYAMPRMKSFLESNGPWSQLVNIHNIAIQSIQPKDTVVLSSNVKVIPFLVPHRDEFSETVGYVILGPKKKILFIPDIDKWEKWDTDITKLLAKVDFAFLDATFYDAAEINNRDISTIPHPFVVESMEKFKNLPVEQKRKVHFIHFNHTNPLIDAQSLQSKKVIENGFKIAEFHQALAL
jgi:pyrroloquinoline quinone biosynthesis protein B